jgi:hypothetical protein
MKPTRIFALAAALLLATQAHAQLTLRIDSVLTGAFPTIEAHVTPMQGSLILRSLDSSKFKVWEDGFAQSPLHYRLPGPSKNFSICFVIGAGAQMSSSDISVAKGIAALMVERMDGILDEAAVMVYGNGVFEQQSMTALKPVLLSRLNDIQQLGGSSPLWDGAYAGVQAVGTGGINISRAMVLLSNGRGDGGSKGLTDVINLAKSMKIPCYPVGINAVNYDTDLKDLANQTGGAYYTNGDLAVQNLIDLLSGTPTWGILEYKSDNACRDGVARNLRVQVSFGNDSVAATRAWPLTADPATNASVTLKPADATITAGNSADVPLQLTPALTNQRLYGGTMTLTFDTALVRLTAIKNTGSLAASTTWNVTPTGTGASVAFSGVSKLSGTGALCQLSFTAQNVAAQSVATVGISDFVMSRGCLTTQFGTGKLTVKPRSYGLTLATVPVAFTWDGAKGYNVPDPAEATLDVTNSGDLTVTKLTATLASDPAIRIAYGQSATVSVTPDSLAPGQKGKAVWHVQALPRASEGTAQVKATVLSRENATASRDLFFNIQAAGSALRTDARVDVITVVQGATSPDPAGLTAAVRSAGTATSPAGSVTVVLPPELTLASGAPVRSVAAMNAGDSTVLQWTVGYPQVTGVTNFAILLITTGGTRPDTCRTTLVVPPVVGPALLTQCVPPATNPDGSLPNPMTLGAVFTNDGNQPTGSLTPAIELPTGLTADAPVVTGGTNIAPGDTMRVAWTVHRTAACTPTMYPVRITAISTEVSDGCQMDISDIGNRAPAVTAKTPAVLDTVDTDETVTFSVTASDADGETLTYSWTVNGTPAGTDTPQLQRTFTQTGDRDVVCAVTDPCAKAGTGDTAYARWSFVVRTPLGIGDAPSAAENFALLGNYPNPFNPSTVVVYRTAVRMHVVLDVVDGAGRAVRTLVDEDVSAGTHQAVFDAAGLPSGVYHARLRAGGMQRILRMTLVK